MARNELYNQLISEAKRLDHEANKLETKATIEAELDRAETYRRWAGEDRQRAYEILHHKEE